MTNISNTFDNNKKQVQSQKVQTFIAVQKNEEKLQVRDRVEKKE